MILSRYHIVTLFTAASVIVCASQHAHAQNQIASNDRARTSFRANGTLMINGQDVFPIGVRIEGEGKEFAKIKDVGFNTLLTSGAVDATFYDEATKHNLWVIGGHYDWAHFESLSKGNRHNVDFYAGDLQGLKKAFSYGNQSDMGPLEVLETYDHYPTVIGWNTTEEPLAKFVEPLETMYEVFKANSPDHLVVTLLTHPNWFHTFKHAGDVTIVDVYPYRGKNSLPAILTYDYVRRAVEETGKPVWLMPQMYHGSYFSKDPADELTLSQIRQASYLGLIGGAKGIIFYSYYAYESLGGKTGNADEILTQRWANMTEAVQEIKKVSPLVCEGRPIDLHLSWTGEGGQGAGLVPVQTYEYYGEYYIMVANVSPYPVTASVKSKSRANPIGFELSVFTGEEDITLTTATDVDHPATITVQPNGQGVVRFTRLPLRP